MKKTKLFIVAVSFLLQLSALAQVQINKQLQLTGTGTDAKLTGIQSVTNALDAASAQVVQSGSMIYALATGSSNNFNITVTPAFSSYPAGMLFNFLSNQNITGPATLNVNGAGSITIKKNINQSIGTCDIQSGQVVMVVYDGTNFQMTSVSVPSIPTIAVAGPNQVVAGTSTTLAGNTPSTGTGLWVIVSGTGGSLSNASNPASTFTGTGGNTYVLSWTISACGSSSSSLDTITFQIIPSSIANLWLWYDANDASTFTLSGSNVSQWNDKSGNNFNCSQATGGNQPTRVTNVLNGKPVVRFNGTSDYLGTSSLQMFATSSSPKTVITVFFATDNTNQRFLLTHPPVSSYCSTETEIGIDAGSVSTGNYGVHAGCGNATVAPGNTILNSSWNIMTLGFKSSSTSPNQLFIYQNGGSPLSVSNGGSGYWSAGSYPTQSNPLYVGGRAYLNDGYFAGDLAEIIVYNRQLSSAELNQLHSYLSAKYNLTVSTIP